jgi:hypothetical protein
MTKRTYTQKDGTEWTWEETKEVTRAVNELHKIISENGFQGNYPGPLYAPHPDIQNK